MSPSGLSGAIVRSEDGGATWSRVAVPFTQDLFGVGGSGTRVVVSGEGGLVALSDDGGKTFRPAEAPALPVTLTDVEFADAEHVYAVGPRGLVLRSDDGGARFRARARGERLVSAAERFSRFFARRRNWFALGIAAITLFFALQLRHLADLHAVPGPPAARAPVHPHLRGLPRRLRQREHRRGGDRAARRRHLPARRSCARSRA